MLQYTNLSLLYYDLSYKVSKYHLFSQQQAGCHQVTQAFLTVDSNFRNLNQESTLYVPAMLQIV